LIYAFYPGQEGGNALADVLFGDYNPGGKMPVTMPKDDSQLPAWNDNLNDDYGCGYRWYDRMNYIPQFAFGYGLSYTTFSYSNLFISPSTVLPGELVILQVDVTNSGTRTGDEVVQLYLSDTVSTIPMPVKELKAFKRVTLDPAQTATVEFSLTADELYYYNETSNTYEVEPGEFIVRVGGSSDNLPLTGSFEVIDGAKKPDLLITNIRMVPPYPLPGQKVIFYTTVKNQGTASTTVGSQVKVSFSVNSQQVSWSDDFSNSIPTGGMALIFSNTGPDGINTWTANAEGTYNVEATVDLDNTIDECVESNNSLSTQLTVYPQPSVNLALLKSVTVSSVENNDPTLGGDKAVDGSMTTRWSSAFSDPQSIIVDLGAFYHINEVLLYWENAYAKEYYLQVSDNLSGWTEVKHETNGDGGIDRIVMGDNARYVRMLGIQRATEYGYSLYEIEVHGTPSTEVYEEGLKVAIPINHVLLNVYPNPCNPSTRIQFNVPNRSSIKVTIIDLLGRELDCIARGEYEAGLHEIFWNSKVSLGTYFCRLDAISLDDHSKRTLLTKKIQVIR
jgi:hypothetical protein